MKFAGLYVSTLAFLLVSAWWAWQSSRQDQFRCDRFSDRYASSVPTAYLSQVPHFYFGPGFAETQALRTSLELGLCLEIGPLSHPSLPPGHKNVRFLDYQDQETLKKRVRADKNAAVAKTAERVPIIHYVWQPGSTYLQLVKEDRFQLVVASHVMEHVPDPISFLNDIADILLPGGEIWLALPDKRFCFDHLRPVSRVSELIGAHIEKRQLPPPARVYEHIMLHSSINDAHTLWESLQSPKLGFTKHPQAYANAVKALHKYVDVHVWTWTPETFVEMFLHVQASGLLRGIALKQGSVVQTPYNSQQFMVSFKKATT